MIAIQFLIKNSSKWKRDSLFLFQQVGLEKLDIHIQKNELDLFHLPYTSISLK